MKSENIQLAADFRRLRVRAMFSQEFVAALFGLTPGAISQIEGGLVSVSGDRVNILRRAVTNPRRELMRQRRLREKAAERGCSPTQK